MNLQLTLLSDPFVVRFAWRAFLMRTWDVVSTPNGSIDTDRHEVLPFKMIMLKSYSQHEHGPIDRSVPDIVFRCSDQGKESCHGTGADRAAMFSHARQLSLRPPPCFTS